MKIEIGSSVLAAVLAAGCGEAAVETSGAPIIGGEQDDHHTSVVQITSFTACTGTYLGMGIVLTAEHCVPLASSGDAVSVTFVDRARGMVKTLASTEYSALCDCSTDAPHAARDLAKILIDDAAVPEGITGMRVLDQASGALGAGDLGERLTAVGFGVTLPPTSEHPGGSGAGARFQGPVTLESLGGDIAQISRAAGDAVPCGGDSGGPLLVTRGGTEYVAGVLSEGDCTTGAQYTRADTARAAAFLGRAADSDCDACDPDSDPDLGGCGGCRSAGSPASLAPFALWLAAVLRRRRRRPAAWATARGRSARSR
ncbi:MAG TPA: trypsin-like serine protease [Kofleriaceae bacterium]|nr:trypsin-like serine protease [Kofleriaceae bacterium]